MVKEMGIRFPIVRPVRPIEPAPERYKLNLFLDRHGFTNTKPMITVLGIRKRYGCTHFAAATVCLSCFAKQSKYRQEVRSYLRFALSDECIERPELRLAFQQNAGHC